MTEPINELAVRLAREAHVVVGENYACNANWMGELVRLALKEGMLRAAKVCENTGTVGPARYCADEIRAEAEKV